VAVRPNPSIERISQSLLQPLAPLESTLDPRTRSPRTRPGIPHRRRLPRASAWVRVRSTRPVSERRPGPAFGLGLPRGAEQEARMEQQKTKLTKPSCPACGFQVFNRRYPKCERCKSVLPASLVYTDQERRALLEREGEQLSQELKQRALQRSRHAARRQRASDDPRTAAFASTPTDYCGTGGLASTSDSFGSGGGGVFDGGGASGSFGGDSGSSSSTD